MTDQPCISSFVIRIIEETDPKYAASPLRGTVRHIQSDEEISFTCWEDVESFIDQYVPIVKIAPREDQSPLDIQQDFVERTESGRGG